MKKQLAILLIILSFLALYRYACFIVFEKPETVAEIDEDSIHEVYESPDKKQKVDVYVEEGDEVYIVHKDEVIVHLLWDSVEDIDLKNNGILKIRYYDSGKQKALKIDIAKDEYHEGLNDEYTKRDNFIILGLMCALCILFIVYRKRKKDDKSLINTDNCVYYAGIPPMTLVITVLIVKEIYKEKTIGVGALHIVLVVIYALALITTVSVIKLLSRNKNKKGALRIIVPVVDLVSMILITVADGSVLFSGEPVLLVVLLAFFLA